MVSFTSSSPFWKTHLRGMLLLVLGILSANCEIHHLDAPGNLVPRTVDEDPSLPSVAVNGTLLHAESYGDPGDPLIFMMHGGPGGDYRYLESYAELANDGYQVVLWDQRGAGLSKRHDPGQISLGIYMEDLRLLIEHYTVAAGQDILFVGHSWGAMYTTAFINEFGDYGGRIKGAVLSEPGAFTDKQLEAYFDRLFGSLSFTSEAVNDAIWSKQFFSADDHILLDYKGMISTGLLFPVEHLDPNNPEPRWRMGSVVSETLLEEADTDGFSGFTFERE